MCDIYVDNCKVCGREVDMHLGDYNTYPDEINVYCKGCKLEKDKRKGVLWSIGANSGKYTSGFEVGDEIWVIPLTSNARKNRVWNHPNVGDPVLVVDELRRKRK